MIQLRDMVYLLQQCQKKAINKRLKVSFLVNNSTGDSMNFNEVFMIVPRSLISLVVLFFVTKLIGKKQVSELSLFDYVIGISIGNFA